MKKNLNFLLSYSPSAILMAPQRLEGNPKEFSDSDPVLRPNEVGLQTQIERRKEEGRPV